MDKLNEYRKSKNLSNVIRQIAQIAYGVWQGDDLQALFERAQESARQKRFFHWKLEFPEVFIDLTVNAWAKDGGFDAVVGNPPYVNAWTMTNETPILRTAIPEIVDKHANT